MTLQVCTLCNGRKTMPLRGPRGWRQAPCGRCNGVGVEPELTLRELREQNQQRLRRERTNGNS